MILYSIPVASLAGKGEAVRSITDSWDKLFPVAAIIILAFAFTYAVGYEIVAWVIFVLAAAVFAVVGHEATLLPNEESLVTKTIRLLRKIKKFLRRR